MVNLKNEEEIALIKEGALILSQTHGVIAQNIKEGMTTAELSVLAEEFIQDHGGQPAFKGYKKFPAALCISVNEQVVHGIPGTYVLKEGDIVSVDCGVYYKGFYSDMAFTYPVGSVDDTMLKLMRVTKEALSIGIKAAVVGNKVRDIGCAIQSYAVVNGCSVVQELTGHGIGKQLHEEPVVPNYGKKGKGVALKKGMVLAIEPLLNLGSCDVVTGRDGWTISTLDKEASAHFEHTIAILEDRTEILTTYDFIEAFFKV